MLYDLLYDAWKDPTLGGPEMPDTYERSNYAEHI